MATLQPMRARAVRVSPTARLTKYARVRGASLLVEAKLSSIRVRGAVTGLRVS